MHMSTVIKVIIICYMTLVAQVSSCVLGCSKDQQKKLMI